MKNICLLLAAVLMLVGISLPAFAAEEPVDPSDSGAAAVEESDTSVEEPAVDDTSTEDGTTEDGTDDSLVGDDGSVSVDVDSDSVPVVEFQGSTVVKDLDESVVYETVSVPLSIVFDCLPASSQLIPLGSGMSLYKASDFVLDESVVDGLVLHSIALDTGISFSSDDYSVLQVVPASDFGFPFDGFVVAAHGLLPSFIVLREVFSFEGSTFYPGTYFVHFVTDSMDISSYCIVGIESDSYFVEETILVDDSSSLMQAISSIFGGYSPRTYSVTTYLLDGSAVESTEIVPGLAGVDWNWFASVGLFVLVLYCIFRMIGGLFRWK